MKLPGTHLLLATALVSSGLGALPGSTAQAATVQATLVATTWTGGPNSDWAHPSPDPSGITYDSRTGRLIISDGEVEETGSAYPKNVWNGTNLYVASLQGDLLETGANTLAYSAEPVGVGFRPATSEFPERLFLSDDDLDRVFEVDRGSDGRYGTGDDTYTYVSTRFTGSHLDDAEDVAVVLGATSAGELLIIDGYRQEVYVYSPGPNKEFDGLPSVGGDDTVRQFDVYGKGARDPEGIAYNPYRNTMFVLDDPSNQIYEFDLQGGLVNIVTLPFTMKSGAGIALAPPSDGSGGAPNAYIVDRGVDNDSNQDTFNDGRLYEVAIPGLTGTAGGTEPTPAPPPPAEGIVDIPVRASTDDAEEKPSGTMTLTSGDLNLGADGSTAIKVGMRFSDVPVPQGATITSAYVQFQADETQSLATDVTIRAETANAGTFSSTSGNISSRSLTAQNVRWQPPAWSTVGARAADQRTPDLASVLQPVVDGSGWASGQALGLVISGTGARTAESYDGGAAKAPVLHIEYGSGSADGDAQNLPPVVDAGPDVAVTMPDAAALAGSVTDPEGQPVTAAWSTVSGPDGGTGTFSPPDAASTSATFSTAGTYVVRLTGSDGTSTVWDDVTVTVTEAASTPPPPGGGELAIPVRAGADDAEERPSGSMKMDSSDLELVTDGSSVQTVGMRFTGVDIPNGATITRAYVQFQTDEATSGTTSLTFRGELAASAAAFTTASGNISSRTPTVASVGWTPEAWGVRDERGVKQQSPDLSAVVQEIVDGGGWVGGNSVALIVTGSGTRTADSFEGGAAKAPVLVVHYTT